MDEKEIIRRFNDLLVDRINRYVNKNIDLSILKESKTTIVLCTGVAGKIEEVLAVYEQNNPDAKLVIIGKSSLFSLIKKKAKNKFVFIEWDQKYTAEIIDKIRSEVPATEADSIIYLCKAAVDMRDLNIYHIMMQFNNIRCLSFSSGEELNSYDYIVNFYVELKCYNALVDWVTDAVLGDDLLKYYKKEQ